MPGAFLPPVHHHSPFSGVRAAKNFADVAAEHLGESPDSIFLGAPHLNRFVNPLEHGLYVGDALLAEVEPHAELCLG